MVSQAIGKPVAGAEQGEQSSLITGKWVGAAGIAFAVSVIAQNLWSQAAGIDPAPDAGGAEVLEKFAENATAHGVLAGWVGLNLVLLAVFTAGAYRRLRASEPTLAILGVIGVGMMLVLFPLLNVPRVALASGADGLAGNLEVVETLWYMHGATFAFNGIALGIGLLGFSLAAARAGLVPRWFQVVGPAGSLFIIAFSLPVKGVAEGEPYTFPALVGFLVWLVFLIVAGVRLWREHEA